MIVHIDWVSFTGRAGDWETVPSHRLLHSIGNVVAQDFPITYQILFEGQDYEQRAGRAPYSIGYSRSDNGVYVFAHPALPHYLVEITGRGTETLGSDDRAFEFLTEVAQHLTRLDIACDMLCHTKPDEFCEHRKEGRFSAWSEVVSASGHTIYVGSRSSDRYARVYRYNEPHPRAHLLRCEFVLKGKQAQLAVQSILKDGLHGYAAALGNTFGWQHTDWLLGALSDAEAAAWRPERKQGKTVRWVYGTVIPALVRLQKEGVLNASDVFAEVQRHLVDATD